MLKATSYKGLQAAINETIGKILQRSMHANKHDSIQIQLIYKSQSALQAVKNISQESLSEMRN